MDEEHIRKAFLTLAIVALLAACAPERDTPQPTDTPVRIEAPRSSPTPPSPETSISAATALPVLPLPVKEELSFTIAGQIGGTVSAATLDGNIVYLGVGPRLLTVDISDPAAPRFLWQSDLLSGMVGAIAVQSGLAYVGAGHDFYIFNMIDPANPVPVSSLKSFDESEQVSWQEIFLADYTAYTLSFVNYFSSKRLIAIAINDSRQPTLVGTRELSQGSEVALSQNELYIASGGGDFNNSNAGVLQLVDPADLERTFSEIPLDGAFSYQVAVSGTIAYVVENRLTQDPDMLLALDVSDPVQPREVVRQQMMIDKSINTIVRTDQALFLLGHAWPEGICPPLLYIIDITNPAMPGGPVEYDPQSCISRVTLAGAALLAIVDDEVHILNVSDPNDITLTSKFSPPAVIKDVQSITLNQGLAYIHSTAGRARLQVLNMTGPTPIPLGEISNMGPHYDIGFQGLYVRGNILFMQIQASMIGFDIRQPSQPRRITNELYSWDNWTPPAQAGNILYKAATIGVEIVDIGDLDNPVLVKPIPLDGLMVTALYASEGRLLVFCQNVEHPEERRLQIFDINNPLEPVEVGQFSLAFDTVSFAVADNMIYAVVRDEQNPGLYLVDISDPAHPVEAGRVALPKVGGGLTSSGDMLYMMMTDIFSNELWALNIKDRSHPYLAGHYPVPAGAVTVDGDHLYLAAGNAGLYILQVEK